MFGINTTTRKTTTTGFKGITRKVILGLASLGLAGVLMGATPAMANDRGADRDRDVRHVDTDRHDDRRDDRRDDRIWVPDRYEVRTHVDHGCTVTDRVLVEAGHFIDR